MERAELVQALRDRFESDGFLGASVLPVTIPANRPFRAGAAATGRVLHRVPMEEAEIERRRLALQVIDDGEVKGCTQCGLAETRNKTAFGVGAPNARIMFIGEAPGHDEDMQGEPFVGQAGQLLTKMIEAGMGLKRADVYICNILKCRPPNNRNPAPDEIMACKNYLWRQIELVRPEVIVALGAPAAQTLLNTRDGIGRLRSQWHEFYPSGTLGVGDMIPLMPTYHPAYLLRMPAEKNKAWADLKMVMTRLDLPIPKR